MECFYHSLQFLAWEGVCLGGNLSRISLPAWGCMIPESLLPVLPLPPSPLPILHPPAPARLPRESPVSRVNESSRNQGLHLTRKLPVTSLLTKPRIFYPFTRDFLAGGTADHTPSASNGLWDRGLACSFSSISGCFFLCPFLQVHLHKFRSILIAA